MKIIDKEEMLKCPLGIYKIYWESGGFSFASIGYTSSGDRWLAPCNWISGSNLMKIQLEEITELELLFNMTEMYKEENEEL